jgi:hypothetical protein
MMAVYLYRLLTSSTTHSYLSFFVLAPVYLFIVGVKLILALDHAPRHTYSLGLLWTSDRPVPEASTCTIHNTTDRQTDMLPAAF